MMTKDKGDLGFSYRATKKGEVLIRRKGQLAATLRGLKSLSFMETMKASNSPDQQRLMARITGNYKRGNEKAPQKHRRNRS